MAIAFDASSSNYSNSATSVTVSHTCTGADRILFVGVICANTRTISSVTYNGVAMTNINRSSGTQTVALYYLVSPATGTHDIVATIDSTSYLYVGAASYTGAAQSGQPDANNTNSSSGVSVTTSVTTVADNCWSILVARAAGDGDTNAGTGCTERVAATGIIQIYDSNGPKTPAGSYSMTTTQADQDVTHAMASFSPYVPAAFTAKVIQF